MKTKTETILLVLKVIAWIAMIAYAIECGSQLISAVVSFINPVSAKQIPGVNRDLYDLLQHNRRAYICVISFVIAMSAMKVYLWLLVIKLFPELNLRTPFSRGVTTKLEKIAYLLFGIWIVSFVGKIYLKWLAKSTGEYLDVINIGGEFLFISGIVYIISQIFKRGIEIQEENQLTV